MYLHVILAYDCHMSAFTLKKGRNGDLRYSLSPLIRIVCIVFAFLLVLGLISALGDGFGISYIFAALFTIILILVALYRDDWIFSNNSRTITVSYGIGPFISKTEIEYSLVEAVEIRHFHKGIADGSTAIKPTWRNKEMAVLRLKLAREDKPYMNMEFVNAKRGGLHLESMANVIASYCALPLDIDRNALQKGLLRR